MDQSIPSWIKEKDREVSDALRTSAIVRFSTDAELKKLRIQQNHTEQVMAGVFNRFDKMEIEINDTKERMNAIIGHFEQERKQTEEDKRRLALRQVVTMLEEDFFNKLSSPYLRNRNIDSFWAANLIVQSKVGVDVNIGEGGRVMYTVEKADQDDIEATYRDMFLIGSGIDMTLSEFSRTASGWKKKGNDVAHFNGVEEEKILELASRSNLTGGDAWSLLQSAFKKRN